VKPKAGEPSDDAKALQGFVRAAAAYGRAESEHMGGTVTIAAYMVLEQEVRKLVRESRKRAIEEAAKIVEPWPHEPPHVVAILSRRAVKIRVLAASKQEETR